MNKHAFLIIFFISCILSCSRCKEECDDSTNPDCPNYIPPTPVDPCAGKSEVSADFVINEVVNNYPLGGDFTYIPSDVVSGGHNAHFHALEDSAEYKWVIGLDTFYTRDVDLYFTETVEGQNVDVKLMVSKTPDSLCFPSDNGLDTLTKSFFIIDHCNPLIDGVYRGVWEDEPLDTFELSINITGLPSDITPDACYHFFIRGFDQNFADSCDCHEEYIRYTNYWFKFSHASADCTHPQDEGFLSPDRQSLTIDYLLNFLQPIEEHHIFHGIRIN